MIREDWMLITVAALTAAFAVGLAIAFYLQVPAQSRGCHPRFLIIGKIMVPRCE